MKDIKGYYFITEDGLSLAGNMKDVESAVAAGVKVVQYRNKKASTKQMFDEAFELIRRCPNTTFIVNDRIDIAMAVDADGVHIGQEDMPFQYARKFLGSSKIIGITVHSLQQAKEAERLGANYLGVSPIYSTKTKHDAGKPVGIELIKEIREAVSRTIPIVAIGGITLENAQEVVDAGANSLCAISSVITKNDVGAEVKKFQRMFNL